MNNAGNDRLAQEVEQLRQRLAELEQERHAERRARQALRRRSLLVAAVAVAGVAGVALASSPCANGLPFCFAPNEPALASEVNANFAALKTWLEAKVGGTGTVAAPNGDITTGRISTSSIAPRYQNWNSFAVGAGGAGVVNDDANYKALMVVGNTSAGSDRKVNIYDDLAVNSDVSVGASLTVNGAFVRSGYQVACAAGESGYHFGFCCRINVRTGAAECRNGVDTGFSSWGGVQALFAATTEGHYSLSCIGHRSSANWPLCCRTNNAGTTECKVSVAGGPLAWSNAASPW